MKICAILYHSQNATAPDTQQTYQLQDRANLNTAAFNLSVLFYLRHC